METEQEPTVWVKGHNIEAGEQTVPLTIAEQQNQDTSRLSIGVVQREWDQTLRRMREVCEIMDASTLVSERQYGHILISKSDTLDIARVEAVVFDNLLFSPWARVEHERTYLISGEWLWKWRRKAPYKADAVGHMMRLAPDAPQRMWTYRMNVINAE